MDRCPRCGSQAWDGTSCVICGHQAGPHQDVHRVDDPEPWWDGNGGDPGVRRLERLWAERDRELDGEEEGVGAEAKTYTCQRCGSEFPTPQALAGHANTHRSQRNGRPAARQRERPPAEAQEPEPVCPLCAQPVPAAVGVLAQQFQQEGAAEELALRLATIAWAGLRTA